MLVTKKFLYAVELLRELRRSPGTRDTLVAATKVPADFADQILRDLRKDGLIITKKGPKGGYAINPAVPTFTHTAARIMHATSNGKAACCKKKPHEVEELILKALDEVYL